MSYMNRCPECGSAICFAGPDGTYFNCGSMYDGDDKMIHPCDPREDGEL